MEVSQYVAELRHQGAQLGDAAGLAGLDAAIPACGSWQVKDLLRHVGYIHRWAARHIDERPANILAKPPEEEALRGGVADADLLAWFRAGCSALATTMAAANPDLKCATLIPAPSPLAFWARRQAHETAVHRADAESAAGSMPSYPPEFAADGIDELIMGFARRRRYPGSHPMDADISRGLQVRASDTGDTWYLWPQDGRVQARRETAPEDPVAAGDGTVSGLASAFYLFLWNRCTAEAAGVLVEGDPTFFGWWQARMRIRWG